MRLLWVDNNSAFTAWREELLGRSKRRRNILFRLKEIRKLLLWIGPWERGKWTFRLRIAQSVQWLGYWLDDRGGRIRFSTETDTCTSLFHSVQTAYLSTGGNAAWAWRWLPPPTSAEVKSSRSYTSIPPYVFLAWCWIMHRDNFACPVWGEGVYWLASLLSAAQEGLRAMDLIVCLVRQLVTNEAAGKSVSW
jgi:hypothetical protein